jgi:hypothetical protein
MKINSFHKEYQEIHTRQKVKAVHFLKRYLEILTKTSK